MSFLSLFALVSLFALSGCAQNSASGIRLAKVEPHLCKHCNCYMPIYVEDDAVCTVCDCNYQAIRCYRDK